MSGRAEQVVELLNYAIQNDPASLTILHFNSRVVGKPKFRKRFRPVAARAQSDNGDGTATVEVAEAEVRVAHALVELPDDLGANLSGPDEERDLCFLFRVKRSVYERMKSGIVTPKIEVMRS